MQKFVCAYTELCGISENPDVVLLREGNEGLAEVVLDPGDGVRHAWEAEGVVDVAGVGFFEGGLAFAVAEGVKVSIDGTVKEVRGCRGRGRGDATYTFRRFSRNQPVLMDA